MNTRTPDILYYDGACPLCRAEIRKLAELADSNLSLQDIYLLPDDGSTPPKDQLLARLHLRRADGTWLTGLEANIQAWQHTKYAACWRLLNLPVIRWFSHLAYELWLKWRQRRNTCDASNACDCRSE